MDLREEVQKLLDEDLDLDEDQTDMLKAAACLLVAAVICRGKEDQKRKAECVPFPSPAIILSLDVKRDGPKRGAEAAG